MDYYIYILYSESSNIYYIGSTYNYKNRLTSHNTPDRSTFTSKHRPWKLAAVFIAGKSRSKALLLEKYIKNRKDLQVLVSLFCFISKTKPI